MAIRRFIPTLMTNIRSSPEATPRDWTQLHAQVHRLLRSRLLLPPQGRSLVAVSGGQDSLCLMRLLLDLQPKWGWDLAIAHCNHRWRSDADANAAYVAQVAADWAVPYFGRTATEIPKSEAAARNWRYQTLAELALEGKYATVVTGHTRSDRAETTLYNLLRGSGSDGLQSLTWERPLVPGVNLVRPLLDITRAETLQFCQAAGLRVWEDETNQDLYYARNRIRQELIPYLQTHFNPQVEQALAQTASLLTADVAYLEAVGREVYERANALQNDSLALNCPILKSVPLAIQRRVIRQFLQNILPTAPNFEHIEKLLGLIDAPNRSQCDPLPGGAIVRVEGEWLIKRSVDTSDIT
jgi:tRNA(Ile)-lysidine synthase